MNQESDEIYQNRLWNLRQIVKAAGGTNALAKITGRKNSQISDLAGPNPQRNIGSKLSASLETELGLAPGRLDIPPPKEAKVSDPYLSQIVATLAHTMIESQLEALRIHFQQLCAQNDRFLRPSRESWQRDPLQIKNIEKPCF